MPGLGAVLDIVGDILAQMDGDTAVISSVPEDDVVQLAAVAPDGRQHGRHAGARHGLGGCGGGCAICRRRGRRRRPISLDVDDLARVVLVDVEPVVAQVDTQGGQPAEGVATVPAEDDAASVGAQRDHVAQHLRLGEGFIDLHFMALAVALYGRSQAAKARPDDNGFDSCSWWRHGVVAGRASLMWMV